MQRRRARPPGGGRDGPAPRRHPRHGSSAAPRRDGAAHRVRWTDRASPRRGRPARSGHRAGRRSGAGPRTRRRGSSSRTRRSAGDDDDRQRLLDEPKRLLGGVRGEGGGRRIDREACSLGRVTCRERVLGEHRQAGRSRVATVQQQIDHRGVDLPATAGRQEARRELADLLVGERVVGGLALGLRKQEARAGPRAGDRRPAGQRPRSRRSSAPSPRGSLHRRSAPGWPGGRAG